ncbi:MAG: uracil-DNA glycosylase [Proteiniphilum sp.]|nr:uracil-DNA glycosylase [Proteiniphilum sp.]MDD3967267.1 uracil-DNA glycosylase [Proteiniphilum sp.]
MDVKIEESWKVQLQTEFEQPYFYELTRFVRNAYRTGTVYPPAKMIFHAFDSCPFRRVKVVIVGQDPYHQPGQAHGLCFSVNEGVELPPSLQNIYKELQSDLGKSCRTTGNLEEWARQGVLLLNATLTVEANRAGSHQGKGWERFTDAVIQRLSADREHLVFMLWGAYAQRKGEGIDANRHLVLKSPHPSPLSAHRGFFGNRHFSRANAYLMAHGEQPIVW